MPMASRLVKFLLIFAPIFQISASVSLNPILPQAAFFPVTKDVSTLQYLTSVFTGQNLDPVKLVLDLNGPLLWVDSALCSSPETIKSCSLQCSMVKSSSCFKSGTLEYNYKTCALQVENPITRLGSSGDLKQDAIHVKFVHGMNMKTTTSLASIDHFLFSCAPNALLKGLGEGANGMFGLGNSRISLPSQISSQFGFLERKFSLCLSSSNGAIFLGGNPFEKSEVSSTMKYTPFFTKNNGKQEGYYIIVNSIKISGKKLHLSPKGLKLTAKLSTVVPYTTLDSKIYGTFVESYIKAAGAMNLTKVAPFSPFEVCFGSKGLEKKKIGPNVPILDLNLQSDMVKWRFYGRNLMVHVSDEVMCLGLLNGGLNQRDPIVIGGHQLEDYLLEFNLGNSMLGFSSSLLMGEKKCSDFEVSRGIV